LFKQYNIRRPEEAAEIYLLFKQQAPDSWDFFLVFSALFKQKEKPPLQAGAFCLNG
jgi:hypothetical protein